VFVFVRWAGGAWTEVWWGEELAFGRLVGPWCGLLGHFLSMVRASYVDGDGEEGSMVMGFVGFGGCEGEYWRVFHFMVRFLLCFTTLRRGLIA